MSFEKEYPNRKDWRKPYYGGKRFFGDCRPHGGCPYCEGKVTHKKLKAVPADEARQIREIPGTRPHQSRRRYMHDKLLQRGDVRRRRGS